MHAYLPKFQFAGSHQIEVGVDADWLHYNADFHRTGYEVLGLSGQLISETLFPVSGQFPCRRCRNVLLPARHLARLETASVHPGNPAGLGSTHRRLSHGPRARLSPGRRLRRARTRISGGYSLTHDAVTMDMLGRPLDQTAVTTHYNPDGTPAGPPAPTTFTIGNARLVLPRATNWTLGAGSSIVRRTSM